MSNCCLLRKIAIQKNSKLKIKHLTYSVFGLKDTHISSIQSVFMNYESIEKAILYGSRAKGNYKNSSDIDLTLIGNSLNLTTLLKIENELDDLLLPYKIDLSMLKEIENQDLIDHINRVGAIFYEK